MLVLRTRLLGRGGRGLGSRGLGGDGGGARPQTLLPLGLTLLAQSLPLGGNLLITLASRDTLRLELGEFDVREEGIAGANLAVLGQGLELSS